MDYLYNLSRFIEDTMKEFEDNVRRHANGISLNDVLKKLEGKVPSERKNSGGFIFRIDLYEIHVSSEKINLFGYKNLINKEFEGDVIEDLYRSLVENYPNLNGKQVEF